jgi:hypothetical protein
MKNITFSGPLDTDGCKLHARCLSHMKTQNGNIFTFTSNIYYLSFINSVFLKLLLSARSRHEPRVLEFHPAWPKDHLA